MGVVDAVASRYDAGATAQPVTWLSGGIVTLINKLGPVLWLAAVVGALSGVFLKTGHFFIAPGFRHRKKSFGNCWMKRGILPQPIRTSRVRNPRVRTRELRSRFRRHPG
jgi:hypothetical protein